MNPKATEEIFHQKYPESEREEFGVNRWEIPQVKKLCFASKAQVLADTTKWTGRHALNTGKNIRHKHVNT